jgi:hypothetical protein
MDTLSPKVAPEAEMPALPSAYDLHQYLELQKKPDDILYAVVDGAQNYRLAVGARNILGEPLRPLFVNAPHHMSRVGPYLVRIKCTSRYPEYLKIWTEELGSNTGVLLLSSSWPQAIRSHLRSIFKVQDERGHKYYFRFYDPRVLRTYLPTCTARECREFFGPIRSIFSEGEVPGTMHHYHSGQSAVQMERDLITDWVQDVRDGETQQLQGK